MSYKAIGKRGISPPRGGRGAEPWSKQGAKSKVLISGPHQVDSDESNQCQLGPSRVRHRNKSRTVQEENFTYLIKFSVNYCKSVVA